MVALEIEHWMAPGYLPNRGRLPDRHGEEALSQMVAVTDAEGNTIAYVPLSMGEEAAQAHAVMFAEAARLLDLIRFAAAHIDGDSHPGLLRTYRAYCQQVLDRIDDAIISG